VRGRGVASGGCLRASLGSIRLEIAILRCSARLSADASVGRGPLVLLMMCLGTAGPSGNEPHATPATPSSGRAAAVVAHCLYFCTALYPASFPSLADHCACLCFGLCCCGRRCGRADPASPNHSLRLSLSCATTHGALDISDTYSLSTSPVHG
jgi:hypothetical protein